MVEDNKIFGWKLSPANQNEDRRKGHCILPKKVAMQNACRLKGSSTKSLDRKSSGKVKVIWAAAPEIGSFTAPSVAFSSASPLAMPSCNRIRQGYDDCDHRVDKYEFCGGSHEDTNDAREACYKAVASGPGTSQNPPNLPGKCPSCEPSQTNGVSSG